METKAAPLSTDLHRFPPPLQPPRAKQLVRAAEQGTPLENPPKDNDTALWPDRPRPSPACPYWALTLKVQPHSRGACFAGVLSSIHCSRCSAYFLLVWHMTFLAAEIIPHRRFCIHLLPKSCCLATDRGHHGAQRVGSPEQ